MALLGTGFIWTSSWKFYSWIYEILVCRCVRSQMTQDIYVCHGFQECWLEAGSCGDHGVRAGYGNQSLWEVG